MTDKKRGEPMVKKRYSDDDGSDLRLLTAEGLRDYLEPLARDVRANPPGVASLVFGRWALAIRIQRVFRGAMASFEDFERELGEQVCNKVLAQVLVGTGRYRYADSSLEYVRPVMPWGSVPG